MVIGHWLKFELLTIFRERDFFVIFQDWAVFLQKRKRFCSKHFRKFFLSQANVKLCKICAKELFCTKLGTREVCK